MTSLLVNIFLFGALCLVLYTLFRNPVFKEGLETQGSTNGIGGGAANYGANIKLQVIEAQDTLLISKYRSDYENSVINLDDLIDNLMLKTALSIDPKDPHKKFEELNNLNKTKEALNNVMKFIDSN